MGNKPFELQSPQVGKEKHENVRYLIQCAYHELNRIKCPWDGSEGRALAKMLASNPSWTEQDWARMVRNYFDSHGVNGDRPRIWLANISRYARGPLDQYGKVHEAPDYATVGKPPETDEQARVHCATCGAPLGMLRYGESPSDIFVCADPKCREGWEI